MAKVTLEERVSEENPEQIVDAPVAHVLKEIVELVRMCPRGLIQQCTVLKPAMLKFYRIDCNDKVRRFRQECPKEMCGS